MRNTLAPCGKNAEVKVMSRLQSHFARFEISVSASAGVAVAAVAIKGCRCACHVINTGLDVTSALPRDFYRQSVTCDWLPQPETADRGDDWLGAGYVRPMKNRIKAHSLETSRDWYPTMPFADKKGSKGMVCILSFHGCGFRDLQLRRAAGIPHSLPAANLYRRAVGHTLVNMYGPWLYLAYQIRPGGSFASERAKDAFCDSLSTVRCC